MSDTDTDLHSDEFVDKMQKAAEEAEDPPPKKKLHMDITLDGHDVKQLSDYLYDIANTLHEKPVCNRTAISGAGRYTMRVRKDGLPPEKYKKALTEWHQRKRARKKK